MAYAGADLYVPVLGDDGLSSDDGLEALIAQLAAVAPIEVDTADGVLEGALGEQVAGLVEEIVERETHAVVQQIGLQTEVELVGRLPLNLVVTDVGQLHTHGLVVELHGVEAGAGGIVRDIVVAADVEAGVQTQIVDADGLGEPVLIGHHPSELQAGEERPLHAEESQSAGILAETAVSLGHERERGIIAVDVVIVDVAIPLDVLPLVADALDAGDGAGGQVGVLVVGHTLIGRAEVAVVEREVVIASTDEGVDSVASELMRPVELQTAHEVLLLGEHRGHHG